MKVAILDGVEAFPSFPTWLQENTKSSNGDFMDERHFELQDLCIPPTLIVKSYKSIIAYGNHFKATTWSNTCSMVAYDSGVMIEFEHAPTNTHHNQNPQPKIVCCVRECK